MSYPTKPVLSIHKKRWCKGSKTAKKPSSNQTVADITVKRKKVEEHQQALAKLKWMKMIFKTFTLLFTLLRNSRRRRSYGYGKT